MKNNNESFKKIFDLNPQPMWIYEKATLKILEVNVAAVEKYGYSREEFLNLTINDIRPKKDLVKLKEYIKTRKKGKEDAGIWEHKKKNGNKFIVHIYSKDFDFDGIDTRLIIAEDITEKHFAEKQLSELENRFRAIYENANIGIVFLDNKGYLTNINPVLSNILGYENKEIDGIHFTDLIHPDDKETGRELLDKYYRGEIDQYLIERRYIKKNGSVFFGKVNISAVKDNGKLKYSIGLVEDITERRIAEEELFETKKLLEQTFYSLLDAVIIVNLSDRTIVDCNSATEKITGFNKKDLIGKSTEILHVDKEHFLKFNDISNRPVLEKGTFKVEFRLKRKDGTIIDTEHVVSLIKDAEGKPDKVVSLIRDITEKKSREKEKEILINRITEARNRLKMLSRKLIELQENERKLISRELHDDVGQSLTALKLNIQSIENNSVEKNREEINDSLMLVSEALEKVRNLSVELRPSIIDDLGLVPAVRWYIDRFINRTGIETEFKNPHPIDNIPDEIGITCYRIIQEALTNISKHSRSEKAEVKLYLRNNKLYLNIKDYGKGFDISEVHKRSAEGESMGILSMQERTEIVNGKFNIKSNKEIGTNIEIEIPV